MYPAACVAIGSAAPHCLRLPRWTARLEKCVELNSADHDEPQQVQPERRQQHRAEGGVHTETLAENRDIQWKQAEDGQEQGGRENRSGHSRAQCSARFGSSQNRPANIANTLSTDMA